MAGAIFQPLNARWQMQARTADGKAMEAWAARFIKPNERLSSFERLEIYNRQYWFRLLDCLYDDYPGVRAVLGERRFMKLAEAYLVRYPSRSFSLRDLGKRLERFLREEPQWAGAGTRGNARGEATADGMEKAQMAQEMARFEWAQVVAFDGPSAPPVTPDDLLGRPAGELRFGLQPYLSLLDLHYAVDEFSLAIKREEALRGEASQAVASAPAPKAAESTPAGKVRQAALPRKERVRLAVHRSDNVVYIKRLEPEAFKILRALQRGRTLEEACMKTLSALPASRRDGVDWSAKVNEWFALWSQLGWLTVR